MRHSSNIMLGFILYFLSGLVAVSPTKNPNYLPADKIFLNCGGHAFTDSDGRNWISDIGPLSTTASTTAAAAAAENPSVPQIPYMNARTSRSNFTYSLLVSPGRIFLRLYFYSAAYAGLQAPDAIFSATCGAYTLLRNFNASQTLKALSYDYMVKEFSIHVPPGERLNITFAPSITTANSYAFVNGIEVVSHPNIYSTDKTAIEIGQFRGFNIDDSVALENAYRLNVGGRHIKPGEDVGLFRSWSDDSSYIISTAIGATRVRDPNVTVGSPGYIAPMDVYTTLRSMGTNSLVNRNFNLTWVFKVDSGFSYFIRLHFCELSSQIFKSNQRSFKIFLNNLTATNVADVVAWGGGTNGVTLHRDFMVFVPTGPPMQDLRLDLHPHTASAPQFYDVILNGLVIFKMNNTRGSLAGQNPIPPSNPKSKPSSNSTKNHSAAIGGGIGAGVAAVVSLVCYIILFRRLQRKAGVAAVVALGEAEGRLPLSLTSNLCRHFSIAEIKAATNNFDEAALLGHGGFGKVYHGEIDGGTKVAIKRGNPHSQQGVREFQTEIEMLSKLRHRHLVSRVINMHSQNPKKVDPDDR